MSRRKVMISSTALDLPDHRDGLRDGCERAGFEPHMMEKLPALDTDAIEASLRMVEEADVYVGVFAWRYGYVPDGHDVSITEMEYNRAGRRMPITGGWRRQRRIWRRSGRPSPCCRRSTRASSSRCRRWRSTPRTNTGSIRTSWTTDRQSAAQRVATRGRRTAREAGQRAKASRCRLCDHWCVSTGRNRRVGVRSSAGGRGSSADLAATAGHPAEPLTRQIVLAGAAVSPAARCRSCDWVWPR